MSLNTIAPLVLLASLAGAAARTEDAPPAKPSPPTAAADKAADIQRLLELTGGARMGEQMMDRMLEIQRRGMPDVPEVVWDEARRALDIGELTELIAAIWDKHFTHDDIRGLIAFYESPIGAKLREMQPMILEESMAAGEAWGRRAMERVQEKLRQKGFPAAVRS